MPKSKDDYETLVANRKFRVDVLDPKDGRRDNIRLTLSSDDGQSVFHHLRAYEVLRLARALQDAAAYGPEIPET